MLIGWVVYATIITGAFALIKTYNYRLHGALGTDRTAEEAKRKEREEKKTDSPVDTYQGRGLEETTEAVVLLEERGTSREEVTGRHSQSTSDGSSQNTQNEIELSVVSQVENAEVSRHAHNKGLRSLSQTLEQLPEEGTCFHDNRGSHAPPSVASTPMVHVQSSSDSDREDDEDGAERKTSTGSRQRVCQRGSSRRQRVWRF